MLACFAFGCRTAGGLTAQTCVHARRPPGSPPKTMVTTSWIREPFIWSSPAARAYRPECLTLATVFKLLVVTKCSVCIERASDNTHTHTPLAFRNCEATNLHLLQRLPLLRPMFANIYPNCAKFRRKRVVVDSVISEEEAREYTHDAKDAHGDPLFHIDETFGVDAECSAAFQDWPEQSTEPEDSKPHTLLDTAALQQLGRARQTKLSVKIAY